MIIDRSAIQLTGQRSLVQQYESRESLEIQVGRGRPTAGTLNTNDGRGGLLGDILDLTEQTPSTAVEEESLLDPEEEFSLDSEVRLFKLIFEKLFGKKVDIKSFQQENESEDSSGRAARGRGPFVDPNPQGRGPAGNFALSYSRSESFFESETTAFSARGVVNTKDGREIDFRLDLELHREFYSEENVSLQAGNALVDPLVLDFDGNPAALTDTRFQFDLDGDGDQEAVPFLASDSAFLAFDRNGDGVINDGTELFGPTTGDGFRELAAYDEDGNNFIDEGDAIFNALSLYNKNGQGEDSLVSLRDRNVGAIYLGSVSTPFSVNDNTGETLGEVRSSGVYLEEDGGVGVVQQVDLSA
jgi:hypothetical protein